MPTGSIVPPCTSASRSSSDSRSIFSSCASVRMRCRDCQRQSFQSRLVTSGKCRRRNARVRALVDCRKNASESLSGAVGPVSSSNGATAANPLWNEDSGERQRWHHGRRGRNRRQRVSKPGRNPHLGAAYRLKRFLRNTLGQSKGWKRTGPEDREVPRQWPLDCTGRSRHYHSSMVLHMESSIAIPDRAPTQSSHRAGRRKGGRPKRLIGRGTAKERIRVICSFLD